MAVAHASQVFWVGPMVGAACASIVYQMVFLPTDVFNR
jgi:glycerol uptake facilitator-like aquaporin